MAFATEQATAVVIFTNDFEDDPVGIYTVGNLEDDWNGTTSNNGVDEGRVAITDDANAYGTKSLVVKYPQGESNNGKSQWKVPLGTDYEELFVSYRIRFDDNFNFVRGGKLPGFSGGADNTGGNKPTGFDGWSARMMWRTNGSGGSPQGDTTVAKIVQYAYHPDQPTEFGEDLRWDDNTAGQWQEFESDQWYHLQHRVVMNTPTQHDGIVQAWLDGEMVLDRQDIRWRDTTAFGIDNFYFSTFFGGSSTIWEASKDEFVYYDDFIISTEFIGSPGDFDLDGNIDGDDLTEWQAAYGITDAADADSDSDSDGSDFLTWQQAYVGAPQLSAVPEPTSAALLLLLLGAGFCSRALHS
ncbi:hypothetical protein HG15A2_32860 [Adhaeretor mobilis]|uniref:Polysaccharide lyase 14 domain-containing protein n=2 Tax=Adhaeretor mobilis TaxID=1930276 RepID=A0A517MYI8_9BACT|nr:hypothetical protein HG15A2_32860 [Adhaeretor mobilis]